MPTELKNDIQSGATKIKDSPKRLRTAALRAYAKQKTQSEKDRLVTEHLPMVQKIVRRVVSYLKPPLSFEDLISAGTIGLVKAARDYEPSHNAEFKTYAYIRIKGAILDELRSWSFVPTNLNKQIRNAMEVSHQIISQTGIVPNDEQLAEKLGISLEKLYQTMENARAKNFLSIDNQVPDDEYPSLGNLLATVSSDNPEKIIERSELIEQLTQAIQKLPKRQKQIIILYYQQNLTMKQAAKVFDITESRVSQLHANALFNLSLQLRHYKNGRK